MSKENEEREVISDEEKKRIENFKKHLKFSQGMISYKSPKETLASSTSIDMSRLQQALTDPYNNIPFLQQVSKFLYYSNGVYFRLVEDFINIPLYDLYLVPTNIMGVSSKAQTIEKMNKEYDTIAQLVEKENYKYNFKWFGRYLLLYGELYLYKVEDNNGIFFKVIPHDICRISGIMENNIYKYSIDLSKLSDEELLSTLPPQLQRLYESYKNGSIDNEKMVGTYYQIDDNEAVAFLYDDGNARTKGVPPLCYLFDKVFRLNEIEDEDLASSSADNLKLVVQKCPQNDEGELLIDPEILDVYHRATKSVMPRGVAVVTSPLSTEVFTLQRQSANSLTTTQKAYETVYTSSGVNSELFNGARSSNESILNSIKTDEMVVDRLNGIFGNFLNYEIKNKKRNPLWKVEMLRNTYFNKKDVQSECRNDLAIGGSKFKYLASQGHTPLSGFALMVYETQMNMNQYFSPVASSYNSSGTNDNGRPANEDNDEVENNTGQADN